MIDRRLAAAALIALATACGGDSTGPEGGTDESDLHFLRSAPDAPPLAETSVSFWAVRGQEREASIWYRPRPGQGDSTEFVEFRVPDRSLVQRPDGTPVAPGDSLLITIAVVDPERLIVEFEPSGLRFAPDRPARLKIRYVEAADDLDDDGDVDGADTALKALLSIFRQEQPGGLWFKLPSLSIEVSDEVEADVAGFTRYAIGY